MNYEKLKIILKELFMEQVNLFSPERTQTKIIRDQL